MESEDTRKSILENDSEEENFKFVERLCRRLYEEGFSEDEIICILNCLDKAQ